MTVVLTPWKNHLLRRCGEASRIRLVCPFVKAGIARSIIANVRPGTEIDLVTRNKPSDFAAGVSDIDALKAFFAAEELGIKFSLFVNNSVHAKVFIFNEDVCYVGSSNLTSAGLERSLEGTVEISDRAAVADWIRVHALMRSKAKPASSSDLPGFEKATVAYSSRHKVAKAEEGLFYSPDIADAADPNTAAVYASAEEREVPLSPAFQDRMDGLIDERFPETAPADDAELEAEAPLLPAISVEPGDGPESARPPVRILPDRLENALRGFPSLAENLFGIPHWAGQTCSAHALAHQSALAYLEGVEIDGRSLAVDKSTLGALNQLGNEAFLAATALIAARSGLLSRYGPAFCSVVNNAFRARGFLPKAWKRHLLPDPVTMDGAGDTARQSPAVRRRLRMEAAHRLFAVASLAKGQHEFVDFIELNWNPLVEYGSDMIEFSLAKDPKTKIQEIAHLLDVDHSYTEHASAGTDHAPEWRCRLIVGKWGPVDGLGNSKKAAETNAIERLEGALAKDRVWQRAVRDYRAKTFRSYMSGGPWPLRFAGRLDEKVADRLTGTCRQLGIALEASVLYGCLVNPRVGQEDGIHFDNSPLAYIGASVVGWAVAGWVVEKGHVASYAALANAVLARLGTLADIESVYEAARLQRYLTPALKQDSFQSIVASLALFGPEDSAGTYVRRLLDRIDLTSIVGVAPQGGVDAKLEVVRNGIGAFEVTADYITLLQEFVHRFDKREPEYTVARAGGPDHLPTFEAIVRWRSLEGVGSGTSAKAARRKAAHNLLVQLRGIQFPQQPGGLAASLTDSGR